MKKFFLLLFLVGAIKFCEAMQSDNKNIVRVNIDDISLDDVFTPIEDKSLDSIEEYSDESSYEKSYDESDCEEPEVFIWKRIKPVVPEHINEAREHFTKMGKQVKKVPLAQIVAKNNFRKRVYLNMIKKFFIDCDQSEIEFVFLFFIERRLDYFFKYFKEIYSRKSFNDVLLNELFVLLKAFFNFIPSNELKYYMIQNFEKSQEFRVLIISLISKFYKQESSFRESILYAGNTFHIWLKKYLNTKINTIIDNENYIVSCHEFCFKLTKNMVLFKDFTVFILELFRFLSLYRNGEVLKEEIINDDFNLIYHVFVNHS